MADIVPDQPPIAFIAGDGGGRIACRKREGDGPTIVFLPGYASDMDGSKAVALDAFAARRGLAMLRFDYAGTGRSDGRFEDGTLASWLGDALSVIGRLADGPLLLVGSSMGGWLALHLALRLGERVHGLVGIAAAPDFTDWGFDDAHRQRLERDGRIEEPNPYGPEPSVTTLAFWRSGQDMLLMDRAIDIRCPVRLVHGDCDPDVPPAIALRLMERLRSADVQLTLIKGGGHRLSEPHEIAAIERSVAALVEPDRC